MNPIEPIRPVPVTRVERALDERPKDEHRPPRDKRREQDEPEEGDENGLDVRV